MCPPGFGYSVMGVRVTLTQSVKFIYRQLTGGTLYLRQLIVTRYKRARVAASDLFDFEFFYEARQVGALYVEYTRRLCFAAADACKSSYDKFALEVILCFL